MFLRFLIIPLGVCFGFVPTRENSPGLFHRSNERCNSLNLNLRCERLSRVLLLSGHRNHFGDEQNDECSDRCKSVTNGRRKALILSGSFVTAAIASITAYSIPIVQSRQQEHFRDAANQNYGKLNDSKTNNHPRESTIVNTEIDHDQLLRSSNLFRVQTKSRILPKGRIRNNRPGPSVNKTTKESLLKDLQSKRAILLGEHHPDGRDHRLQAALIRSLYDTIRNNDTCPKRPIVVGLEAIQRKFQPVLDQYCAGTIDEAELQRLTEWESRWYWSFEAYKPIFQTCRELGIGLLALDIATEDRLLVEKGGLDALDRDVLHEYIPDQESFLTFGNTLAYQEFVNYTLKPPFQLQERIDRQRNRPTAITFSNFVARQMLRDEGMASAAFDWLSKNPNGVLVGCIGINHATFGCGVQGRLEQKLSEESVVSVLINPDPLNTGTDLKICQGRLPIDDQDDTTSAGSIFVPNTSNQVCIENSVEAQNYALQVDYTSSSTSPAEQRTAMEAATRNFQAQKGENVLALSDYLIFSPKKTIPSPQLE